MLEAQTKELELLRVKFGEVEADPNFAWVIIKKWPLIPGWNKPTTEVQIMIPSGYPFTPPDNFFTDNDLRLANGQMPGNASPGQTPQGKAKLSFSYHVEVSEWKADADPLKGHNILTFLTGVEARLKELS